jgi:hypothetical protein
LADWIEGTAGAPIVIIGATNPTLVSRGDSNAIYLQPGVGLPFQCAITHEVDPAGMANGSVAVMRMCWDWQHTNSQSPTQWAHFSALSGTNADSKWIGIGYVNATSYIGAPGVSVRGELITASLKAETRGDVASVSVPTANMVPMDFAIKRSGNDMLYYGRMPGGTWIKWSTEAGIYATNGIGTGRVALRIKASSSSPGSKIYILAFKYFSGGLAGLN